ncbi:hypothetical protein HHK36_008530 [Tetracentron sinense]|uniref:HhH-GPD domain-containing protein n=1 Tax=Tetracentron sinense TaxID=13715 RepID=A0A835DJE8_TETSI|nr:hypothetical protein HHK36_008530 [Tetracentron sinense]
MASPRTQAQQQQQQLATTTTTTPPQDSSLRPRKIRKTSHSAHTKSLQSRDGDTKKPPGKTLRLLPRFVAKPLSSQGEIALALHHLRNSDPNLARVIDLHLPPTFDTSLPPFLALTKSILYQQLAFKAATTIYTRFVALCGGQDAVVPESVFSFTPHDLRQIGISGRKARYLHDLASKYCTSILSDAAIVDMDDKSLFSMLTMVEGIGPWSVHMFMIFSLHRPDVLPVGDLGVRKGLQLLYSLEELPKASQMEQLSEKWRPYRSVASWYLWRLAEAKAAPATPLAVAASATPQQQQQLLDPINEFTDFGFKGPQAIMVVLGSKQVVLEDQQFSRVAVERGETNKQLACNWNFIFLTFSANYFVFLADGAHVPSVLGLHMGTMIGRDVEDVLYGLLYYSFYALYHSVNLRVRILYSKRD